VVEEAAEDVEVDEAVRVEGCGWLTAVAEGAW